MIGQRAGGQPVLPPPRAKIVMHERPLRSAIQTDIDARGQRYASTVEVHAQPLQFAACARLPAELDRVRIRWRGGQSVVRQGLPGGAAVETRLQLSAAARRVGAADAADRTAGDELRAGRAASPGDAVAIPTHAGERPAQL